MSKRNPYKLNDYETAKFLAKRYYIEFENYMSFEDLVSEICLIIWETKKYQPHRGRTSRVKSKLKTIKNTLDRQLKYIYLSDCIYTEDIDSDIALQMAEERCLYENIYKIVFPTLIKRDVEVLKLRFGLNGNEPNSLKDVSEYYDVTEERIRQIEAKVLRKLRHPSRTKYLK